MSALQVAEAAEAMVASLERGEAAVTITLLDDAPGGAVQRMVLTSTGSRSGSLGELDAAARDLAARAFSERGAVLDLVTVAGREIRLFAEPLFPRHDLVIVGAGHIAVPLAAVGVLLGFRVHVLDDREDMATGDRFSGEAQVLQMDFTDPFAAVPITPRSFVVLVTRAHKYDYDSLRRLLDLEERPFYIGMIGSRRRVRATFDALQAAGYGAERLKQVHAPIGIDIGAETPAEIAISIAAELVRMRSGAGSARTLSEQERVVERFYKEKT